LRITKLIKEQETTKETNNNIDTPANIKLKENVEAEKKSVRWEHNTKQVREEPTEKEKQLWIYLSNVEVAGGEQGWSPQHDSWQQTIIMALGYMSRIIDIYKFKRIIVPNEKRLVIAAPDAMDRRTLLGAIKD
jgi:hypothetical protein